MKTYPFYLGSGNTGEDCRVVVQRGDAVYDLNPRHDLRNHSPDGFAWGYGGSGPAQLSLALLADFFGPQSKIGDLLALEFYQEFKWFAIAPLKANKWTFTAHEMLELLRAVWRKNPEDWADRLERACERMASITLCRMLDEPTTQFESADLDKLERQFRRECRNEIRALIQEVIA